jgi:radical SAM protein with 4Fe4S-binding SPASM domain
MECPQVDSFEKADFFDRLNEQTARRRVPLSGSLELTFRCNLRCTHCYLGEYRDGIPRQKELSTAEICDILDQITDAGCLWLLLTGGEPLVRPDFLEIYTYAKRKGLIVTFFTNGTLLTPRIADALAELPPFLTEITLYGATQATYEGVTCIPGSYHHCLRGIELLLERKIPLKLKTMVMRANRHEFQAMRDFASSLGVEFRYDAMLNAGMDGSRAPLGERLTPKEVVQFDLDDPKRLQDWKQFAGRYADYQPDASHLYLCGAAKGTFHIDPYGYLSPCIMSRLQSHDLRHSSFKTGWLEFLGDVRGQPLTQERRCSRCKLVPICAQCPGWAILESGDQQQPVDYLCQIAHLRAEAIGLIS